MSVSTKSLDIVIPLYDGGDTIERVVDELILATKNLNLKNIYLVWDAGSQESVAAAQRLAVKSTIVKPLWLSRNYGEHAAVLAGLSETTAEWVITVDEDGQHDPADIAKLLAKATETNSQVVYGIDLKGSPHSWWRKLGSKFAHWIAGKLFPKDLSKIDFSSFRLIDGEISRKVSNQTGPGTYVDVALTWFCGGFETVETNFRTELRPPKNYSLNKLIALFWRMVISSGTKPLRLVSIVGLLTSTLGVFLAILFVIERINNPQLPLGWASVMVVILFLGGLILVALGVIAEYLGLVVTMAMGKPTYSKASSPHTN
ncbi:MAG: glycosyltransferase [Candidatus Nanopelagicales bacterium]